MGALSLGSGGQAVDKEVEVSQHPHLSSSQESQVLCTQSSLLLGGGYVLGSDIWGYLSRGSSKSRALRLEEQRPASSQGLGSACPLGAHSWCSGNTLVNGHPACSVTRQALEREQGCRAAGL